MPRRVRRWRMRAPTWTSTGCDLAIGRGSSRSSLLSLQRGCANKVASTLKVQPVGKLTCAKTHIYTSGLHMTLPTYRDNAS
jgi:hypothetical protein